MRRGSRIERNMSQQQVTLGNHHRKGLLRKAILCYDAVVALIVVISGRGCLYNRLRQHQVMSSPMKWTSFQTLIVGSFLLCSVLAVESIKDWEFYCGNETFATNDQYENGLKSIERKLPPQVSLAPSYFHSVSSSSMPPEQIYAAGVCREDISPTVCKICIRQAVQGVGVRCPFRKVAAIVYDRCSLWISNREFVDLNFNSVFFLRYNTSRAPVEREILGKSVIGILGAVAAETSKSPARFATVQQQIVGAANRYTVYAFAQCIPRVMRDCESCLNNLIDANMFLPKSVGGEIVTLWCQFQWELYPFITGVTPTLVKGTSEQKWKRKFIIFCSVGGSAFLSLLIVLVIVLSMKWWRKKGRHSSTATSTGKEVQCTGKVVELQDVPCRSALEAFQEIVDRANNKEIGVFLDYDGTLSPIVNNPKKAYMSSEMRQVLQSVADNFKTSIISGRAIEKLSDFVQIDNINYVGSHGNDIKMASTTHGEITEEQDSYQPAKEFAPVMNQVYNSLVRETKDIDGAEVENNNFCVSVHYRNVAEKDHLHVEHVVKEVLKTFNRGLDLTRGQMVHEVRPPKEVAWDKGTALAHLLHELGLDNSTTAFSIYIGDDLTDEDAFKVIRDKNSIGIGILVSETSRDTSAYYSLKDPSQVMEFLKLLLENKNKSGSA